MILLFFYVFLKFSEPKFISKSFLPQPKNFHYKNLYSMLFHRYFTLRWKVTKSHSQTPTQAKNDYYFVFYQAQGGN